MSTAPLAKICGLNLNTPVAEVLRLVPGWVFVAKHLFRRYRESAVVVQPTCGENDAEWMEANRALRKVFGSRVRVEAVPYTIHDIQQSRKNTTVLSVQLFAPDGSTLRKVKERTVKEVLTAVQAAVPCVSRAKMMQRRGRFTNFVFVEMPSEESAGRAAGGPDTGMLPVVDGLVLSGGIVAHGLQVDETPFDERDGVVVTSSPSCAQPSSSSSDASSIGYASEDDANTKRCGSVFRHNPYSFDSSKEVLSC